MLEEYLRVLKAAGVREFTWGDMKIALGPAEPQALPQRPTAVKNPSSLYENPLLWPGGVPPKFHNE